MTAPMIQRVETWIGRIDRIAPLLAAMIAADAYGTRMMGYAARPRADFAGWWGWTDQGLYLRAAQAWSAGVLDRAEHWYFPGYAMLAAPFVRLLPIDPFTPVDVLCLIVSTLAFCALAERLLHRPGARTIGAAVWIVTVSLNGLALRSWVEPWTTTPVAALSLISLWLMLRLIDGAGARTGFGLGLAAGAVLLFRPTDALVLCIAAGVAGGVVVLMRRDWRLAAAGIAGVALPIGVFGATYLALYGLTRSDYLTWSALVGFEWRLLPLRWVTLVIDPAPLIPDETGLSRAFWWVIPGVMGGAACLAVTRGRARARHAAVLGTVALHVGVYLAYRDLHPQGLIRFGNYHYFKWVLPVLGLYTVALVLVPVWFGRCRVGWGVAVVAAFAFFWRAEFVPGTSPAAFAGPQTIMAPAGLGGITGAMRVAAAGGFTALYQTEFDLIAGGTAWANGRSFKTQPVPGGLLLVPLRPLPAGPATVTFPAVILLDTAVPPVIGRQEIRFALPVQWGWPGRTWHRLQRWRAR